MSKSGLERREKTNFRWSRENEIERKVGKLRDS